jgi:ferritin-like metal-binding protein YciE
MRLGSLHELFLTELHDMYDAENQLIKALPKMADTASYPELKNGINEHLEQTRNQVRRLEEILENFGEKVKGQKCHGMRGTSRKARIWRASTEIRPIAAYGTLCAWADAMGHQQELKLLKQTLQEEKETDRKLTQLAERTINVDAVGTVGGRTGSAV